MVQNILIPIPEDILNEKNLVPQLESSKDDKNKTDDQQEAANQIKKELSKEDSVSMPTESPKKESKGGCSRAYLPVFGRGFGGRQQQRDHRRGRRQQFCRSDYRKDQPAQKRQQTDQNPACGKRLAFQPNRAEISGTTLKWIQAFANKVNSDRSVISGNPH